MYFLPAIYMEGKGCMGKFLGGNDAELVGNAATHLHGKLKAELQFFWLNIRTIPSGGAFVWKE